MREIFFFLITKKERIIIESLATALARHARLQSIIWLHDGLWVFPQPTKQALAAAIREAFAECEEPAQLFRLTPVKSYLNNDSAFFQLHKTRANFKKEKRENDDGLTWHKSIIKDSLGKVTRAKQVRDLTIQDKKIIVNNQLENQPKTLLSFFKKKGIHL